MKSIFFLLLVPFFVTAQNEKLPIFDGVVTEEEWEEGEQFTIDYEISPGNNAPAPVETKAFIQYSETHLYVGFIAYIDMSTLRSSIRNRDEGYRDDFVMVGLDTYADGRYMVSLGANAEGNQLDLKFLPNGDDDTSYNVNFESKASKHEDAYHVELKIPFSVLQFKNEKSMKWNILLYRSTYTKDSRSRIINFPIDLNNPCLACQTPVQITLNNIKPKNRVELIPYGVSNIAGERDENEFNFGGLKGTVGLSGLFDLNNTTSLEYAINPDFSQVEADVSQIIANNTFAIAFPERRAYFNEGNDIISSNLRTVYTRAISKPLLSTKLISQGEKNRVYWLAAYDESSPYLIGGENKSYSGVGGSAYSSIFKYQRAYKQGSNISFTSTNRFFKDSGYGHIVGLSGLWRFAESYTAEIEANMSLTKEPTADWIDTEDVVNGKTVKLDGEELKGDAIYFSLQRNTKNWNSSFEYSHLSPHYQAPLGFVSRNNRRGFEFVQRYQKFFEEDDALKELNTRLGVDYNFNYDGITKYSSIFGATYIQYKGNFENFIDYSYTLNEEYEGFNAKGLYDVGVWTAYNPSEKIRIGVYTSVRERVWYDEDNPTVGDGFFIGTFNNFQVTPKLRISPTFRYSHLKNREEGGFHFKTYIGRVNVNYQFNETFSFRVIAEYNDADKKFFYQPLFKWNPNTYTIFYIGGTNGHSKTDTDRHFKIDSSQIYMKFQYLFSL